VNWDGTSEIDKRTRQAGPSDMRTSIVGIGGSGSTPIGHRGAIRADGKVVEAKAFTEKRR